jgi:AraC family transcriptional regulator of arabinose operon
MDGRRDGFPGQRIVVVPEPVLRRALREPLTCELLPSDIGHFPRAIGHGRERPNGADQAILIACLRGRGWCQLGPRRVAVEPGHVLGIRAGTAHAYGADLDDPWTISWLHLAGRQVAAWFDRLGFTDASPVQPLNSRERFAARFDAVLTQLEHGTAGPALLGAAGATWDLLGALAAPADHAGDPIAAVIAVLRERLDSQFTVRELAAVADLSPAHFAARFRRATGHPPLDYHIRLKLRAAAELLDTTALPIAAVARRVGYDDAFYFSRRFRAAHGISPAAWRAQRKG